MKKLFSFILLLVLVLLVSACGVSELSKSKTIKVDDDMTITYNIDVPYYGNIKIGNTTIDMYSTKDMLKEKGIEPSSLFDIYGFKVKDTGDKFSYETMKFDDSYEVMFTAHNDIYEKKGCTNCDSSLAKSLELPKGITYKSTIDDVIKAYGEPSERTDYDDENYNWGKTVSGDRFEKFESNQLHYDYKTDQVEFLLELWFDGDTNKLYRVHYQLEVKKQ